MKKIILFSLFSLILSTLSLTQGIVRGKIVDETGEALIGATVIQKNDPTNGTSADLDGNYSIRIKSSTPVVLIYQFIGQKTIERTVNPKNGEVIILNMVLAADTKIIDEVNVVYRVRKDDQNYVNLIRRNASVSVDMISKETLSKTGDSDVNDAMKRITGVSSVGGYISVRGLADRYIKTTINGSKIPTLDPLKNNIKLDLIPTNLIDNIMITKTMSPDLPADWAGSFVSIQTKDYPEMLTVSAKASVTFNNQSSFQDVLSSNGSKTDILGFDYSYRDINHDTYKEVEFVTDYDVSNRLYGDYLQSLGITNEEEFLNCRTCRALILNQAGLIAPSEITNTNTINDAWIEYKKSDIYADTKAILNERNSDAIEFGTNLPNNWFPKTKKTSFNYSEDIAVGNRDTLFGKQFGYIFGIKHSYGMKYDANIFREEGIYSEVSGEFSPTSSWHRAQSEEYAQLGALMNLALKFNHYNSLSFMMMANFLGNDTRQRDSGKLHWDADNIFGEYVLRHNQEYDQRRQLIYQVNSSHVFRSSKIKLTFNASYVDGDKSLPDFKSLYYGSDLQDSNMYSFKVNYEPVREFAYLKENVFEARSDLEIPIMISSKLSRKLKFGGAFTNSTRESKAYTYFMYGTFNQQTLSLPKDTYKEYFEIETFENLQNYYFQDFYDASTMSSGTQSVYAGYGMIDLNFNKYLRLSGGARAEYSYVHTDLTDYYNSGIPENIPIRNNFYGMGNPYTNKELNVLPSINGVYKIVHNEKLSIVSRVGVSQSLARPTIKEVTNTGLYDFTLEQILSGNITLKPVYINNFDFRLESYFNNRDNISVSVFYKTFENHIEIVYNPLNRSYTWVNAENIGTVRGVELEGSKRFLQYFDIMGNITYMESKVEVEEGIVSGETTSTRPLYGQSPYIINGTFSYTADSIGLKASLSYNIQGPKLAYVTLGITQPDVYEMPRHRLDFKISKTLGKHWISDFSIRDILGTSVVWAYDNNNFGTKYKNYSYGTSYKFGIAYKL